MPVVDTSPRTFSGTTTADPKRSAQLLPEGLSQLPGIIKRAWPDLKSDAQFVLIPLDDFHALIELLNNQPYIATRGFIQFSLERLAPKPPRTLRQKLLALLWGEW